MDKNLGQVIWRVILPPGEDFWRFGPASGGVKIQHVNTGKFLSVTKWVKSLPSCEITALFSSNFLGSHRYPEPWGEGMREVVALKDDASSSLWAINFYQLPDMGQNTHYAKAHSLVHIYFQRKSYPPRLKRSSIKEEHRISRLQLLRFVEENYPQEIKEIYKVNRCLARYSPRATTTNRPKTGHWISLHGLAQIDQKCQFWAKFGRFGAKNPNFYWKNQKFCYPLNRKPT